jgi:hypothetical protein
MSRSVRRFAAVPFVALLLASTLAGEPKAAVFSEVPGVMNGVVGTLTQVVDGAVGGLLTRGSWSVLIPAGAFEGSATITMTTGASDPTLCQYEISPATKNGFSKPAIMTARIPLGMSLATAHIEWYNPSTQTWVPVPGSSVNALTRTVSAPVWHFSDYRVNGRSGW